MGDLVGARSGAGEPEGDGAQAGRAGPDKIQALGTCAAPVGEDSASSPRQRGSRPGEEAVKGSDEGVADTEGPSSMPEPESDAESDVWRDKRGRAGRSERKQRSFWKELPILVGIALLLALVIKTFFVQAFSIPSVSMQNTLQRGDRVLVDKLTPWFGAKPERGEVVVFHDPGGWLDDAITEPNLLQEVLSFVGLMPSSEEKDLIKRVIAVGGDKVECSGTGPVKVNGKALEESYVFPGVTPCGDRPFGPVTVPEGRIWVMGDHRNDSLDSRYHQDLPGKGTIAEDQVVGRAFVVAWPVSRWGALPVPDTFEQPALAAAEVGGPLALGLMGAVPLTLLHRRRVSRKVVRVGASPGCHGALGEGLEQGSPPSGTAG